MFDGVFFKLHAFNKLVLHDLYIRGIMYYATKSMCVLRYQEYVKHSPFSSLVLEILSFTVYFLGKRRSLLHPKTAQRSFSHYNLILTKLREKMPRKTLVNIQTKCAHALWAS